MDLDSLRTEIDKIDEKILSLISERAAFAKQIGEFKSKNNIAVFSKDREDSILNSLVAKNNGPLTSEAVKEIFTQIITSCRELQQY